MTLKFFTWACAGKMHATLSTASKHVSQSRSSRSKEVITGVGVQEGTPTRSELLLFKMPCSRIDRIESNYNKTQVTCITFESDLSQAKHR
jgi:hypothetical protein